MRNRSVQHHDEMERAVTAEESPSSASDHPATWKFDYPIIHAETRAQWRSWLARNHPSTRGVWLCSWRTTTDRPRCPYPEAVEEAICFGWIDSTNTVLDEERSLQLFTPRRPKSQWTRLNRKRATDMEDRGLMTEAGRRTIAAAKTNGWWTIADQVEDLQEPLELTTALNRDPNARNTWDGFPPSARKQMLWWIVSAVRDDTRAGRITQVVAEAAAGRRARG
ncbi:YdeI/OmpD-associated family protein [Rhodococcoides yunnanense]|uniref:YdeI/OmpD-associated family protein n=1 Tax=Rhodococcoides yunnanense TaxID=278209 RepID=A0ABU4BDH1_9NOCA|nr:YdeI/OmpD-associated family protein [Rhodococcus yunnanensis]MDV6262166.1 YdeI/OmpD-associated family protein [Rhodococcus yunnanensis]